MAIVTIQTSVSPFSGKKLASATSFKYDTSKINWSSLESQNNDTTCRFLYLIKESVDVLPFDSSHWGMAYVNCTTTQLFDAANSTTPTPSGLTINYVSPINGIALISAFGETGASITLSSTDAGVQVWSIENIVNPTGGGGVEYDFSDSGFYYIQWTSVGATTNGTITFNVKLTIGAQSTTKPMQIVISNL